VPREVTPARFWLSLRQALPSSMGIDPGFDDRHVLLATGHMGR
jgi:hypothetical protein